MEGDAAGWMFSRTVFKGKGHTLDELWTYTLVQPATEGTYACSYNMQISQARVHLTLVRPCRITFICNLAFTFHLMKTNMIICFTQRLYIIL